MNSLLDQPVYREDLSCILRSGWIRWDTLEGKSLLLSGATGMIGSLLVDALMTRNGTAAPPCHIYALGRNPEKARARFARWWDMPTFHFVCGDVNTASFEGLPQRLDFVLHLASNTHPVAYATDPIGTVTTNIIGTQHLLELACRLGAARFLFASSNEIYGENRGDRELFDEHYLGYIDSNTLRAGYPESKRCGEALCQAYRKQRGLDAVVARLTRSFGPSLLPSDTKAMSQFLRNGARGEDIVLKSKGDQLFSYTYTADAVTGLLTVLLNGTDGEAYNIAEERSDVPLKEIAALIARAAGTQVVFDLPDAVEAAGFSKATKARLDGSKLRSLGWRARFPMKEAIRRTLEVLREGSSPRPDQ